jgi:Lysine methyltransferase
VIPELQRNLDTNSGVGSSRTAEWTRVQACPLRWGDAASATFMLKRCGEIWGVNPDDSRPLCHLILAADVVYHEHLIDPLLDTLVELTDPTHGLVNPSTALPPLVVISYVQRFKRAKAFVKKARKRFDVETVQVDDVVDYDTLNWNRGSERLVVNSGSACWKGFKQCPSTGGDDACAPSVDIDTCIADEPVSCLAYHYLLRRKRK